MASFQQATLYTGKQAPIDVRNEAWYMRYFNVNESALNNLRRKNANTAIKMVGIQGDLQYGLRTRHEWTCLQEDINQSIAQGKIRGRPMWSQIDFKDLKEELKWAQKSSWWGGMRRAPSTKRAIIVCSCPSQIGNDKTIMRQVEKICEGRSNVELTFSEAGNASSELFVNMSIGGGGGGASAEVQAQAQAKKERAAAVEARRKAEAAEAKAKTRAVAAKAKASKPKLSAAEQKKQNKALFDASENGEMGKLEAAIAAGAEVDWHNPNHVSELSKLE